MAPQNEGNKKSGDEDIKEPDSTTGSGDLSEASDSSSDSEIQPFSDNDPFRAARTREVISETARALDPIQAEPVGFENLTDEQKRYISEDALERSEWSQARQDGFTSILRLGRSIPPRSQRVL